MLLGTPDDIPVICLAGGRAGGKTTALVLYTLKEVLRHGPDFEGVLLRRDLAGLKRIVAELEEQMSVIPQLAGQCLQGGRTAVRVQQRRHLDCGYIKDERSFGKYQGGSMCTLPSMKRPSCRIRRHCSV